MRRALLLCLLLVVGMAAPAGAQVDEAVDAFRRGDPVYVHPDAELRISEADADRLRERIRGADHSIFVAVLPERVLAEADVSANEMPNHIYTKLWFTGTYA